MSGFLRGWLRDLPLEECCRLANACGAFAVSRHGCAPAIPSWTELEGFLRTGSEHRRLREDAKLEQVHWATNRSRHWPQVLAFAFDHRAQFEEMCERARHQPRAHPLLQAAGAQRRDDDRGRARRRRHPARRPLRPGRAGPGHRQGPVDRPAGRAAGLAPVALRGRPRPRLHLARMAGRALRQVPGLLPPRRPGRAVRGAGAAGAGAGRRLPPHRPRPAARGDPGQVGRAGRRAHARPRHDPLLRARRLSRLVEAAAPGQRRGLAADRRRHRRARPALPRRPAARAWTRPRPSWSRRSRWRAGIRSARASPSAGRSSASRRRTGSPAGSTTSRRSRPWRPATGA